jgi:hypothetical protein
MSDARVLHVIPLARENEELRATVSHFKAALYVSLRVHFLADDGQWYPTKKGITLAAARLDELEHAIAALRRAVDAESSPQRRKRA